APVLPELCGQGLAPRTQRRSRRRSGGSDAAGTGPIFEPVGNTDSEHLLCWLLRRIHEHPARSLEELGYDRLESWLAEVNELGTLNLGFTDGVDLAVYQDRSGFNTMHWIRRLPPHSETRLADEKIALDFSDPYD